MLWKRRVLSRLHADELRLVVATKAFGTGVDYGSIGFVVLDGLGDDLEGTYQVGDVGVGACRPASKFRCGVVI